MNVGNVKVKAAFIFTLKLQLQNHCDGTVSCNRVCSVSVTCFCSCNFSERVIHSITYMFTSTYKYLTHNVVMKWWVLFVVSRDFYLQQWCCTLCRVPNCTNANFYKTTCMFKLVISLCCHGCCLWSGRGHVPKFSRFFFSQIRPYVPTFLGYFQN